MNCLICDEKAEYYFSKNYPPSDEITFENGFKTEYFRCINCGFVISNGHLELSESQWNDLNSCYHHYHEKADQRVSNQPPYIEQALALKLLHTNKIINSDDCLDYAAGYGTLNRLGVKYFDFEIKLYEPFVLSETTNFKYLAFNELSQYDIVLNSAMFEHIRSKKELDNVNRLVRADGVLMVHTVICEKIPKDSNWFYLDPVVHSAFHTNKSMQILMKSWQYSSSVYCPSAKSWFLFKDEYQNQESLNTKIELINQEFQTDFFLYKKGFMDYWKGF